jgi:hypothetical protein
MISFGDFDDPYVGFAIIRETCDRASLSRFARGLFDAWLSVGAPAKGAFALRALGWFGDDDDARELGRLIRVWPGESAHARATVGLDALAGMGVTQGMDIALMILNTLAEKAPTRASRTPRASRSTSWPPRAAQRRRTRRPHRARFRARPTRRPDLDFGPRRFHVGFDAQLRPLVRDADGRVLKDLPKPLKSDDAERRETRRSAGRG